MPLNWLSPSCTPLVPFVPFVPFVAFNPHNRRFPRHKLILLTIAAFLIHSPSLSAQNHLPPSLDPANGGQAVTSGNISPDQIISILVRIEAKVDNLDKRVARLETKVDNLDKRLDDLEKRFVRIEAKVDDLDKRVTRLETKVDNLDKRFVRLEAKVDNLDARVDNLGNRLDGLILILVAGLLGMPLLNNWLEKRRETKRLPQVLPSC